MAERRRAPKNIHRRRGRPQRRPCRWPRKTDLLTREGLDAFLRVLIKKTWTKNPLDSRTVGALNNTTRLLLESRGWIQKTPLQIIQAQVVKQEINWKQVFEEMSEADRLVVARFIQGLEKSESQPSSN